MCPADSANCEPVPFPTRTRVDRWSPVVAEKTRLPVGEELADTPFVHVLDERTSQRNLEPLSTQRLATFLWHGARVRETNGDRQHRAAPSAGAIHPLDLLILSSNGDRIDRYDPFGHTLDTLAGVNREPAQRGYQRLRASASESAGTYLIVVADLAASAASYEHAESLVWRDAGAFLATLQLVATALELGFCILGPLGHDIVSALSRPPTLIATGAAVVGENV